MDVLSDTAKLNALGQVLDSIRENGDTNATRILSHVVTESIEGRSDRIKAYTIAQDVLHRGADFDPATDSIVRVEMKRLRETLDHYYATTGRHDPVRIEIPKGSYVPVFIAQTAAAPLPADPVASPVRVPWRWISGAGAALLVVVLAFGLTRGLSNPPDLSRGEPVLAVRLGDPEAQAAFQVARNTLSRFKSLPTVDADGPGTIEPDYLLTLNVEGEDIGAVLTHSDSGRVLDARNFRPSEIGDATIPDRPTRFRVWLGGIASRNGLIESNFVETGDYSGDFACSVLVTEYFADQNNDTHLVARDCLMNRLDRGIESARLYLDLALITREEHADQRNPLQGPPLARAGSYARKAVALDPFDAHAHYALMTILFAVGGWNEAKHEGEQAVALLPFDGRIVGGYAARINTIGEHRRAQALFALSRRLTPGALPWREYGDFLAFFGLGQLDKAAEAALSLFDSQTNIYLAALAIGLAHRGELDAAREVKQTLLEDTPDLMAMYMRRGYEPGLAERLVAALQAIDAG